jgi:hypothetical protein
MFDPRGMSGMGQTYLIIPRDSEGEKKKIKKINIMLV